MAKNPGVVLAQPGNPMDQNYGGGFGMQPMMQAPSGIDYLASLDKINIHQILHAIEGMLLIQAVTEFTRASATVVCSVY